MSPAVTVHLAPDSIAEGNAACALRVSTLVFCFTLGSDHL